MGPQVLRCLWPGTHRAVTPKVPVGEKEANWQLRLGMDTPSEWPDLDDNILALKGLLAGRARRESERYNDRRVG